MGSHGKWIVAEQGMTFCAVSDERKHTAYAFVSWRVRRIPSGIDAKRGDHCLQADAI